MAFSSRSIWKCTWSGIFGLQLSATFSSRNDKLMSISFLFQWGPTIFVDVLFSWAFLVTSPPNWFFFPPVTLFLQTATFSDTYTPLVPGLGDTGEGRSTEQGKPLWKKCPSPWRSRTTEQTESCWILSALCSRISVVPCQGFAWQFCPRAEASQAACEISIMWWSDVERRVQNF